MSDTAVPSKRYERYPMSDTAVPSKRYERYPISDTGWYSMSDIAVTLKRNERYQSDTAVPKFYGRYQKSDIACQSKPEKFAMVKMLF